MTYEVQYLMQFSFVKNESLLQINSASLEAQKKKLENSLQEKENPFAKCLIDYLQKIEKLYQETEKVHTIHYAL